MEYPIYTKCNPFTIQTKPRLSYCGSIMLDDEYSTHRRTMYNTGREDDDDCDDDAAISDDAIASRKRSGSSVKKFKYVTIDDVGGL